MIYHINYYSTNTATFTSIIAVNQITLNVKDYALIQFSDSSKIKL